MILILFVLAFATACGSRDEPGSDDAKKTAPPSDRSVGASARLYIEGQESIMVAVDEKALNELVTALASRQDGADNLLQSGKVFTAPNGSPVRILENKTGMIKVRVLEGDNIMKEGWVHERWIQ